MKNNHTNLRCYDKLPLGKVLPVRNKEARGRGEPSEIQMSMGGARVLRRNAAPTIIS